VSIDRIVVGVDGSEGSSDAVLFCADLASAVGAEVVAVHAFEPLALLGKVEPPVDFAAVKDQIGTLLHDDWCQPLAERGVAFRIAVVEDDPVTAMVDAAQAEGADLVVVGTRGLGGVKGLVLGSVATKLPHRCPVPVTIIPPRSSHG
jgi:nucleotide-binding universal stress UspA family protein